MKLKQRLVCGITAFMFTTFVIAYVCVTQGQVYLEGTGLDPENKFRFKLNDVAYAGAADLFRTSNRTDGNKNGILLRRQLDQSISRSGPNKTGSDPDYNNNNGDKTNHGGELSKSAIKQNKVLNSEYLNRTRLEASSERNISFEPGKEVISVISAIRARPANLPEEGNFYNIPHKYPKIPAVQVANRSKFEALFRNFSASYVVPGQLQKHDHLVRYVRSSGEKKPKIWEEFQLGINRYEVYSFNSSVIDDLLRYLGGTNIKNVDEKSGGTQVKLSLKFLDGGEALMKPWRVPRDYETLPDHFYFSDIERHNAEIAAFHLDRILDFRRVPPVAGRWFNLSSDVYIRADESLRKTFFRSPANNLCFVGHCSYYCESETAVCGKPDTIEGSVAAYLPAFKLSPRKTWKHPWRRSYSKHKSAMWEHDQTYCTRVVMRRHPYNSGRRLLDLMDMSVFDFLIGNMDRHHYETFEHFGNFTYPIHLDHGRAFGKHQSDEISILAPLFQCCIIRKSTYDRLVLLNSDGYKLGDVMRESLSVDLISPVLFEPHYTALNRRLETILRYMDTCFAKADNKTDVLKAEPVFNGYRERVSIDDPADDSDLDDDDADF
ncbi:extracellular serine/threonine protein CG31145-like isoform X1 [Apostichopus japonicus]|uniref:extracellular serine/threonine protein CG31145-like isoform X1 n=1 Tax=Stichopus japonicus TaxID=307972 RepID=UPI003AB61EA2